MPECSGLFASKLAPTRFVAGPDTLDTECLLANLSETLASASAMVNDLTFDLKGSPGMSRSAWHR